MTTQTETESRWVYGYEDCYEGQQFDSAGDLVAFLEAWSAPESRYAALNVPIWINADEYEDERQLTVGMLLTRKGRTIILHTEHFEDADVQAIRLIMMRVWAMRADTGFARYQFQYNEETDR